MINNAVIMGRLTADPELRKTQSGVSVTTFSVAVPRRFNKGEENITDFLNVVAWRNSAEFVCKYFKKGQMIAVQGSIQTRTYEDAENNVKRYIVEIVAENVSFCGGNNSQEKTGAQASDVNASETDDDDLPF